DPKNEIFFCDHVADQLSSAKFHAEQLLNRADRSGGSVASTRAKHHGQPHTEGLPKSKASALRHRFVIRLPSRYARRFVGLGDIKVPRLRPYAAPSVLMTRRNNEPTLEFAALGCKERRHGRRNCSGRSNRRLGPVPFAEPLAFNADRVELEFHRR